MPYLTPCMYNPFSFNGNPLKKEETSHARGLFGIYYTKPFILKEVSILFSTPPYHLIIITEGRDLAQLVASEVSTGVFMKGHFPCAFNALSILSGVTGIFNTLTPVAS